MKQENSIIIIGLQILLCLDFIQTYIIWCVCIIHTDECLFRDVYTIILITIMIFSSNKVLFTQRKDFYWIQKR